MNSKRYAMLTLACCICGFSVVAVASHNEHFVDCVFHPDITESCTKAVFCDPYDDDEYYEEYDMQCGTMADVEFTFNTKNNTLRGHTDGHTQVDNACGEFVHFKNCPGSDFGLPGYGWETSYHVHSNGDAHLHLKLEDADIDE